MKVNDFDYKLPRELIAQYPVEKRDESRLLVVHRDTGKLEHRIFRDIGEYFCKGDLLVLNNTKVVPARLVGKKDTGGKVEVLILESQRVPPSPSNFFFAKIFTFLASQNKFRARLRRAGAESKGQSGEEYEVLLKPVRRCKVGSKLIFGDGELKAEVTKIENGRPFLRFDCNGDLEKLLSKFGKMPLPPYIKREPEDSDSIRYQTVYADKKGAIAAPTAGLHFTKELLDKISRKGVDIEYITLHVGYGTFRPVKSEDIEEHKMEKEYFEIVDRVVKNIKSKKGRIFVVGTTTCRVLETVFSKNNHSPFTIHHLPYNGYTNLFIYPPYRFKAVDALLTNFHLPRTTLLMLVSAFCGRELLFKTYQEAIKMGYRFYSYGDAMLIL